jgi:hypothetical protein
MKIENLEKAQELMNKRSELKRMSGLLAGNHSVIMVYETNSTSSDKESTWDEEIKAGMMMILEQRISEVEKEIETL